MCFVWLGISVDSLACELISIFNEVFRLVVRELVGFVLVYF